MARKKVTLQYTPNDSTRRGTFKKRHRGLMKKASELAILCDVRACVLVYDEGEMVPEVFPSHVGAVKILNIFKNMPELEQYKKMMNQEGFLRERIDKLRDQLRKFGREAGTTRDPPAQGHVWQPP
ncbi:agamous-like MADS-box protein AGL80 [Aegilops tauschii subsp. strangulata]|uniref:Agamous-like MADS-box protein AGL80 n=1 Tax=Aegilops tauschii TaxID=37682 RepID=R7W5Q2_AEGTA|nr:agamous-like MADS-box protein AGL80 [Aegilops tauschii subsp. strangulata]